MKERTQKAKLMMNWYEVRSIMVFIASLFILPPFASDQSVKEQPRKELAKVNLATHAGGWLLDG